MSTSRFAIDHSKAPPRLKTHESNCCQKTYDGVVSLPIVAYRRFRGADYDAAMETLNAAASRKSSALQVAAVVRAMIGSHPDGQDENLDTVSDAKRACENTLIR